MTDKPFHGVSAYQCCSCGKNVPIDIRFPNEFTKEQWEGLFAKLKENEMICMDCQKY